MIADSFAAPWATRMQRISFESPVVKFIILLSYLVSISLVALYIVSSTWADNCWKTVCARVQLWDLRFFLFIYSSQALWRKSKIFTGVPHLSVLALCGHMVIEGYLTFSTGYAIVSITVTAGFFCHAASFKIMVYGTYVQLLTSHYIWLLNKPYEN